jgi:predicted DNA-binding ribbon-helix-helix protein
MGRVKFMLSLHDPLGTELQKMAERKNITIQELIRAVVIPEWREWREIQMNGFSTKEETTK